MHNPTPLTPGLAFAAPPDENAATVVLLHASASSARQWQELSDMLKPRHRVLTVEVHGHGSCPVWQGRDALTLADDAALVAPLLARHGGAHLVGHSYGAAVALKLATLAPSLVHSVVAYEPVLFRLLLDAPGCRDTAQQAVAVGEAIRERLARGDLRAAAQCFVEFWSGAGAWQGAPEARQQALASRMPSVLRHFDALTREPLQATQLARLPMPLLMLTGSETVDVTRRIGALLRARVPLARHELLPGLGHMGPITHAPLVNRRIAAFVDAASPTGRGERRRPSLPERGVFA